MTEAPSTEGFDPRNGKIETRVSWLSSVLERAAWPEFPGLQFLLPEKGSKSAAAVYEHL